MPLEPLAVEHACNVIRREIADEIPELTLMFMAYDQGGASSALIPKQMEIKQQPGGESFWESLNEAANKNPSLSGFQGLLISEESNRFFKFMTKEKYLAIFLVNANRFEKTENVTRYAYHLAWHALNMVDELQDNSTKDNIKKPAEADDQIAYNNMLADAFAALVIQAKGEKAALKKLARARCDMSLLAQTGHDARQYPYPIALDAALLVYQQLGHKLTKTNLFPAAFQLSKEIGYTFDLNSVKQWWAYARPAQEMAWCGTHKNKILGAATFSSEDPYIRTIAHIVSETLGIDPPIPEGQGFYNAFTDQEVNERHHKKLCEDLFQQLSLRVTSDLSASLFFEEAEKQNQRLLNGEFFGWCADALYKAGDVISENEGDIRTSIKKAQEIFEAVYKETGWKKILSFGQHVMRERMKKRELRLMDLEKLCRDIPEFMEWTDIFRRSLDDNLLSKKGPF